MTLIDRRSLIARSLAMTVAPPALSAATAPALTGETLPRPDPVETIRLWPAGAPGMPTDPPRETVVERSHDPAVPDRAVHGITDPRLVVFRPDRPNGRAVMIMPGGAYRRIVIDKEGYELGRLLSAHGYTVFVLFYRLPGEGWRDRADTPLADAQRAIRLIRAAAPRFAIDPARICAMGFSAGGHLCDDLAVRFDAKVYTPVDAADALPARPDLAAPLYAVQSMRRPIAHAESRALLIGEDAGPAVEDRHTPALHVTPRTPPCFLVHAEDDPTVPVANTLAMRAALRARDVPVETHLFERGGHGFGLRFAAGKPVAIWSTLFMNWVDSHWG